MNTSPMGLAFAAGLLSILSPCVLPLLPLVFGSAATGHRYGPAAMAAGVALSFTAMGLFVAAVGFSIGLDGTIFRQIAAVLLVTFGIVLVLPTLQFRLSAAGGSFSNWANNRIQVIKSRGLGGQLAIGTLLGMVWSPCVGPTLGAASILAAQGSSLRQVGATMLAFGFGAALPLISIGMVSRRALMRWHGRLLAGGKGGKTILGGLMIVLGISIISGLDKQFETILVDASPAWLTNLTTRF